MNKTEIEYCDYTWNPFSGCLNKCPYCYARKIAMRFKGNFEPTFHPERLYQPQKIKKPSRIFVGSMGEIGYMAEDWVRQVIDVCEQCPQHTFLFLTKCANYNKWKFPKNCWLGWTFDGENKGIILPCFSVKKENNYFLSLEPLLKSVHLVSDSFSKDYDWVIIGAETCNGRLVKEHAPNREWIEEIVEECRKSKTPLFLKNNLKEIWGKDLIQEIPKEQR